MHPRLIEALRKDLCLSVDQATDDELLRGTEGTFMRARLELQLACQDFGTAITEDAKLDWDRLQRVCRRLIGR
jgi:hypothetical protein